MTKFSLLWLSLMVAMLGVTLGLYTSIPTSAMTVKINWGSIAQAAALVVMVTLASLKTRVRKSSAAVEQMPRRENVRLAA